MVRGLDGALMPGGWKVASAVGTANAVMATHSLHWIMSPECSTAFDSAHDCQNLRILLVSYGADTTAEQQCLPHPGFSCRLSLFIMQPQKPKSGRTRGR